LREAFIFIIISYLLCSAGVVSLRIKNFHLRYFIFLKKNLVAQLNLLRFFHHALCCEIIERDKVKIKEFNFTIMIEST